MTKILKRVGLGILVTVLALVVFLLGSIIVDGFFAAGRLDPLTNMSVTARDGTEIRAYLAEPEGEGPFPAVMMIHEFWGLREDMLGKAEALADEGYVVITPNVFRSGTTNWIPRAIYNVITADTVQIDSDVQAVYDWLSTQPNVQNNRIAIMGFCFGGGTALRYGVKNSELAGTAIFYGQVITDPQTLQSLSGPVLGIFGGADQSIPVSEVEAFRQGLENAGVPHEVTIYEGQPHAFVGSIEEIEAGGADQEAWQQLLAFLDANLKAEGGAYNPSAPGATTMHNTMMQWRYLFYLALGHMGHL